MILPDTNIWIDHLRQRDDEFTALLVQKRVALHPFVLGEISLGVQGPVRHFVALFSEVRQSKVASAPEILSFISDQQLHGTGIGYVDAHLLAATMLTENGQLWTRDKRLHTQAERLGVAYIPA
jgi:predicted nucleic acid-binding protein